MSSSNILRHAYDVSPPLPNGADSHPGASPSAHDYDPGVHRHESTQWDSQDLANRSDEHNATVSMNSRKRRYTSSAFTSRKRAATACNFCRVRKTKCDNARPKCGYCRHHKATCIYDESAEAPVPDDDGNTAVIQRLEEIKQLLQQMQAPTDPTAAPVAVFNHNPSPGAAPSISDAGQERESLRHHIGEEGEHNQAFNPYASPYRAARCEAIVRWPIFKNWLSEEETRIESFLHEAEVLAPEDYGIDNPDTDSSRISSPRDNTKRDPRGIYGLVIDEEDIVPLCKSFLSHVHFRNPILEPKELMTYAKQAAQHGVGWDAGSCLVLVISAISCILSVETPPSEDVPDHPTQSSRLPDRVLADPAGAAEAFSQAAKKRIGLLEMSILDIECLFFLSIYEKLRIRPLQSWFYLQQACSRLKSHLMKRSGRSSSANGEQREGHQVEHRVFWACVRSETELLPDMCLPSSSLESFQYPEFPSPPSATSQSNSEPLPQNDDSGYVPEKSQARSWLFFLAEISLRRTINTHLRLLYRKSEPYWLPHLPLLIKHHAQCEEQISLWYSHLPAGLQFSNTSPAPRSLSFYLESRFQDWHEYILRPLLYCALHYSWRQTLPQYFSPATPVVPPPHTPSASTSTPLPSLSTDATTTTTPVAVPSAALSPEVHRLAQNHIALCAHLIPRAFEHGRFGGVWQLCRRTFTCGMAILASVISDELQSPDDWVELCRLAIRFLAQWSAEARTVEAMRRVLSGLFEKVLRSQNLEGRERS